MPQNVLKCLKIPENALKWQKINLIFLNNALKMLKNAFKCFQMLSNALKGSSEMVTSERFPRMRSIKRSLYNSSM